MQRQFRRLIKIQFDTKEIQDDILKKKIKTTTYWIDLDEPKLTFQKHDLDHETIIILNKAN